MPPSLSDEEGATVDQAVDEPFCVNKRELARVFDVHEQTISRWVEDGCPVEEGGSNGTPYRFDVGKVRAWRKDVDTRTEAARQARDAEIKSQQQSLFGDQPLSHRPGMTATETKDWLQAEHLALRLSKERRELIPADEVRSDYAAVFGVIRQQILGLGPKLGRILNLAPEQQHQVDQAIRDTLIGLHGQISAKDLRPK